MTAAPTIPGDADDASIERITQIAAVAGHFLHAAAVVAQYPRTRDNTRETLTRLGHDPDANPYYVEMCADPAAAYWGRRSGGELRPPNGWPWPGVEWAPADDADGNLAIAETLTAEARRRLRIELEADAA